MKVFILASLLGFVFSARLDHLSYLPPSQRLTSGAFGGYSPQTYSSSSQNQVPILKLNADNDGDGTYQYNYETANSITAEEQGDARGEGTRAHGSYSYVAPDGQHISITYTADENGFLPQGSHIPTPPPIPEAILKALQENAAAEARGIFDDGQYRGKGEGQYKNDVGVETFDRLRSGSGGYSSNGGYKY